MNPLVTERPLTVNRTARLHFGGNIRYLFNESSNKPWLSVDCQWTLRDRGLIWIIHEHSGDRNKILIPSTRFQGWFSQSASGPLMGLRVHWLSTQTLKNKIFNWITHRPWVPWASLTLCRETISFDCQYDLQYYPHTNRWLCGID